MTTKFASALLTVAALAISGSALSADNFPIASFVPKNGPGIVALVAIKGKIVYSGAAGYAHVAKKIPMKAEYRFNMASVSKHFTAMAILLLEADGKIAASDSIRKHIPELPKYTQPITIRHLVHHQGGLPDYEGICGSDDAPMTNQALVDFLKTTKKPQFAPGKKYQYSNSGYGLLAEIVARASRMPFEDFMARRIFTVAGLKDSFVLTPASLQKYQALPVVGHYEDWKQGPYVFSGCDTMVGDGSVISNIFDLHAWFSALHKAKIADAKNMKKYFTPFAVKGGPAYAYGLEKYDDEGEISFTHDGSWGGYISSVIYYPAREAWIITISNYDGFESGKVTDALYEKFLSE
jgi:CubicO group peptidase (beta-lactamase class C family)